MIVTTLLYPGDPEVELFLMFGKEFREKMRFGLPGEMKIRILPADVKDIFEYARSGPVEETVIINEIKCDQCGRVVGDEDPLAMTSSPAKVFCWPCHENLNRPYMVRGRR